MIAAPIEYRQYRRGGGEGLAGFIRYLSREDMVPVRLIDIGNDGVLVFVFQWYIIKVPISHQAVSPGLFHEGGFRVATDCSTYLREKRCSTFSLARGKTETNMDIILLVEDNQDDIDMTLRALEKHRISDSVIAARDGVEALEWLIATGKIFCLVQGSLPLQIRWMP